MEGNTDMSLKMKELPNSEKPYEKVENYGPKKLSNTELLEIIIKSGTKHESALNVAQKVLTLNDRLDTNNLTFLSELTINELIKINGIGKVKAIQILATAELARRMTMPVDVTSNRITSTEQIAKLFITEMCNEKREIAKLVILNSKNIIMKIIELSIGGTNYAVLEPKIVLEEPVKLQASKIILVHNHPSGDPTPSQQDFETTERIYEAASIMGIELLDHIVIGKNSRFESVMYQKNKKRRVYR